MSKSSKISIAIAMLAISTLFSINTASAESDIDPCTLPKDQGDETSWVRGGHYYYNSESKQCEFLDWKGGSSNANNFKTKEDCEQACVKT
ncbi:Kunitz-type serine protease inhibitor bitisilin-3 [Orchesella cincta]|uniref:Kunitz-type serine protease inhibitor bitisilin-3 n=1 Tax=Orchesella cincta TaxID=48709 RepID=A0A1D2ND77_ORCCI|nr:Kunitz-type serine protease inhibitor bitisilin-3 [Orchesella cincta]